MTNASWLSLVLLGFLVSSALCLPSFFVLSPYAPVSTECPSTPLIRAAEGLSSDEEHYQLGRRAIVDQAFWSFINSLNKDLHQNDTFAYNSTPVIGLASSAGKLRALLAGAGLVQALDAREEGYYEPTGVSGIYQAFAYHAGVDGGAWLVSTLASNNNRTATQLYLNTWHSSFSSSTFLPDNTKRGQAYARIAMDLTAKEMSGFQSTLVDSLGGLLSYHLLNNTPGGIRTFSDLDMDSRGCDKLGSQSLQYEFHPYETGTWESGHRAFTKTAFLGTTLTNGVPLAEDLCIKDFDNLGFIVATSSGTFFRFCSRVPGTNLLTGEWGEMQNDLIGLTSVVHRPSFYDEYGVYPNPFYRSSIAPGLSSRENLYLVDGAVGGQTVPLWPLIQPERRIDAIIVHDNSANTKDGYPDGTSLYQTWMRSQEASLKTMPAIPTPAELDLLGLDRRPVFFGCHDLSVITIIYLPNRDYVFEGNFSSFKLNYSQDDVTNMIANGNKVAARGGDPSWPFCLTCGLLLRVTNGQLPSGCHSCLSKYCWPL